MKLINCPVCNDVVCLSPNRTRECECGHVAGKYLEDRVTAVISKDAIVFGIDNNGFAIAKHMAEKAKDIEYRVDYFITGWIPNHPGEIRIVQTVEDVYATPPEMKEEEKVYTSTLPTESGDYNPLRLTGGWWIYPLIHRIKRFYREWKHEKDNTRDFWV